MCSMPPWTDLGTGVRVRRSRAFAMNSTLLLDPAQAVLVDPGVLPSELDDIAETLRDAAPRSVTLIFTHPHWDHVLGRPWWPWAMLVAHPGLGAALERDRETILAEAEKCAREHGEEWTRGFAPCAPQIAVSGDCGVTFPPWALVVRDAPGHCDSQITIHVPDRRLLIAGDMLSDVEIPWLDREPGAYQRTLEALVPLAARGEIEILVPGHGSIARGAEAVLGRLRRDLAYLDALESGVREARDAGLTVAETEARLASLEHPAREAPGMTEVHRENVRIAWERTSGGSG
jgi:glyoxylase-like metal-dependent hydrolase (beta-lactamase superfamily II)